LQHSLLNKQDEYDIKSKATRVKPTFHGWSVIVAIRVVIGAIGSGNV